MSDKKLNKVPDLLKLRDKIDAVDKTFLELLAQRSWLVHQVAQAKRASGQQSHILRPAREAQQMRKFVQWHQKNASAMPLAGFQAVWREIISSSVSQQDPLTVFYASDVLEAAKAQFGQAASYVKVNTAQDMMQKLSGKAHAIGVFDATQMGWLPLLYAQFVEAGDDTALSLFLGLPLFDVAPALFCIGRIPLEPSGDDMTLIIGLQAALPRKATPIACEDSICLAMVKGFMTQKELELSAQKGGVKVCGSFSLMSCVK